MTNYAELYEKETGYRAWYFIQGIEDGYTDEYVSWLSTDEYVSWLSTRCERAEKLIDDIAHTNSNVCLGEAYTQLGHIVTEARKVINQTAPRG